jgi:hypothetical protein
MKVTRALLAAAAACMLAALLLVPVIALAQGDGAGDIGQSVGDLINAVRAGQAIAIASTVITILVQLFKAEWTGALVRKIPARWRVVIPIVLGGVAGILASIAGGVPWLEAVVVGLLSGPSAVFGHEVVVEAILGHSVTRKVAAEG